MSQLFDIAPTSAQQLVFFYQQAQVTEVPKPTELVFVATGKVSTKQLRPKYFDHGLVQAADSRLVALISNNPSAPGYLVIGDQAPTNLPAFPKVLRLQGPTPYLITANVDWNIPSGLKRIYQAATKELERRFPTEILYEKAAQLEPGIPYLNLPHPVMLTFAEGQLIGSQYGQVLDHLVQPKNVDLVTALLKYESFKPLEAIAFVGELCVRCRQTLRRHYHFSSTQSTANSDCYYCKHIDPEWEQQRAKQVVAAMDPRIFEKFISFDSFFGNYMVKRYADILRQERQHKDGQNQPLPDIEDQNWDEYFEQMLFQVMDHSNDLRVQQYINDMRKLPLTQIVNDQTVKSPYPYETKPGSVYQAFRDGKKVSGPGKLPTTAAVKSSIWEPKLVRRRYSVNNFPIYPSSNIHWVKRINDKHHTEFQVLNFYPPEELGVDVLALSLSASQGYQLFPHKTAGKYPTSQNELNKTWNAQHPFTEIGL